jgi:hypothetical protein
VGREDIESELMFKALSVVNTRVIMSEENLTMKGGDLNIPNLNCFSILLKIDVFLE